MNNAPSPSTGQGLINLLGEHFEKAEQECSKFTFNQTADLDSYLVSLYITILRHGESIRVLVTNDLADSVPQLLRSMLEAYLDLVILEKDASFGYRMEKTSLANKLRMMDGWPESVKQRPEWNTLRSTATAYRYAQHNDPASDAARLVNVSLLGCYSC
jgi:hypothetical protein